MEIKIFFQFLTFDTHFVRRGCHRQIEPAILTLDAHFTRKGCFSWRLVGAPPELREKDKSTTTREGALEGEEREHEKESG